MAIRRFDNIPISQGPARGALAMAMVNPLEDTLSAIEKFGQRGAVADATQQATNDVLSGGNPGMSLGLTPAGQAYNEAAQKAYETRTSLDLRAKHAELSARYTGQNPGDAQAYAETMGQYVSAVGAAVPDSVKPRIMAEAHLRYAEGLASVTEATNRHQYALNVSEMQAGYKASVDDAAGLAMAGKPDLADAALLQSLERADNLVAIGAKSPGEGEMMKREARATVAAGTLYQGFLAGHVSIDAVENGDIGADLPGHIRESLVRQMEAEQAHRRSEQNHAIAMGEKMRAQGDRDLEAMGKRFELGIPPTSDDLARLNAYSAGQAPASPVKLEETRAAFKGLSIARDVATATPEQIAATQAHFAQNPPKSIEEALVREKAVKAFDARQKGLADDPASYAMTVLPDKFPPVVLPTDPGAPEFDAALRQLSDNADGIRSQFGVDASPLTKEQGQQLAQTLGMLPADQKALVHAKIVANLGQNAPAFYESIAKGGALIDAHVGLLSMQGRSDLGSAILQGQDAIRAKVVPTGDGTNKAAREALANSGVMSAFPTDPRAQEQLMQAATALAAGRALATGNPENLDIEQALKDLQPTGKYAGRIIALPPGVTDVGDFRDVVQSVTDSEIAAMGGDPAGIADYIRGGMVQLESRGEGQYSVVIGTRRATNPDGSPFVLDFSKIVAKPAVKSPFFRLGGLSTGMPQVADQMRATADAPVGFDASGR